MACHRLGPDAASIEASVPGYPTYGFPSLGALPRGGQTLTQDSIRVAREIAGSSA
jgi:hypothetical protein